MKTTKYYIWRVVRPLLKGYVTEAPIDGNEYARKDGGWSQVVGGGGGSLPAGGTTGQVLTKQSNADGDAVWETIFIDGGTS